MCMVYDEFGNVLVQDRVNKDWPGITFPGGHVEANESITDSVIREVFEETGLKILTPKLCGIKNWINEDGSRYVVFLYKTNKFSGFLRPSDEGEVYWIKPNDLKKEKLANDMEKMLQIFIKEDFSEFYYFKENAEWQSILK